MKLIKSISGIRGIYNKSINDKIASDLSVSFSSIQQDGPILLARDTRPHGKNIYTKIKNSLIKTNRIIIDCGIIPTPTAQFIIKNKKLAGGIIITASHNPIEWNGLKFLDNDGCFLNEKKMQKLLSIKSKKILFKKNGYNSILKNAHLEHISNILNLKCIDINKINAKQFKVIVDTVNGAAYKALPELLKKLNCNVIKIHCKNTGDFPRGPEPTASNLNDLSKAVIKHNADIGFATDPDADRLAIVDNKGLIIGEESTLILSLESYLKYYKNSQRIVTNLSTSMGVDWIADKYNSTVERTPVGEINVVEKMKEINSNIGGEGNGGVILKESHLGRDSLVASALILNHLANSNLPLNKIIKSIPQFIIIKDKITVDRNINFNIIKSKFQNNKNITFIEDDGLKILWKDKWVHIRKSNTEPIIRIISEATSNDTANQLINSIKSLIT